MEQDKKTKVKIKPSHFVIYAGFPLILPKWFVKQALEENLLRYKKNGLINEMELVEEIKVAKQR
jgi:hypothetical protein